MAVFGAGAPANATVAMSLLGDNAIAAGYTPASALGEFGIVAACVASLLGDEARVVALTVGNSTGSVASTQITKVTVFSPTLVATTASTNSWSVETVITITGLVSNDKLTIYPNVNAISSVANVWPVARCSVTDQMLFTVYAGNTTGTNVSGVYRVIAIRS